VVDEGTSTVDLLSSSGDQPALHAEPEADLHAKCEGGHFGGHQCRQ